jgi:hypothetical protein
MFFFVGKNIKSPTSKNSGTLIVINAKCTDTVLAILVEADLKKFECIYK